MTDLPKCEDKKLGLLIDLDICVGCHACVVSCKEWNSSGDTKQLSDVNAHQKEPVGTFLNHVHSFEKENKENNESEPFYFPKSCLHCEDAPCVTVCPTGASYKRPEDGIVLVNEEDCMGCGLCAWACPYGARELDLLSGVMKKCTLCVDRIDDHDLPEEDRVPACVKSCPTGARSFGDFNDPNSKVSKIAKERKGVDLMPEMKTKPVNKYLLPRIKSNFDKEFNAEENADLNVSGFLSWVDKALDKL
tara:strand:+ start:209 stop:949 length:741 start_codon:yes stop_codon:yes gene_type:complete